jgi:hypothetical protein
MFLVVVNPLGLVTSLDLVQMPIWRLELRVGQVEHVPERKTLALGISYVTAGTRAFATIAALDCQVSGSEVEPIAAVGFPHPDRQANKERLREALKALINTGVASKDVEDISARSAGLVDAYHDILQACWGFREALAATGPAAKGEVEGWKWALLRERFSSWLRAAVAPGSGMAPAPGSEPMAPPPGSAAETAASLRPNPLGDPPGTEKKKTGSGKSKTTGVPPADPPPPTDPPAAL